ncbi:pyruvate dehydrogenase (acetyl-transferring) E1 component subunit alpha [Nocardioides carbamazepini]|uniref:thiamine pyrophosphate-dependent enzyme n=1 Tax=Nocardioides carbamazepini TaxID=2854259 RepID=UPI00214A0831|nr:thiamine pyrophosphate-dependent enzyme [Nocardioides carbamazepini]MCR1781312.1 pyruvate dehydrogenase (acetyl-transferring) E1 component subunit alpha [Nocardioides carbamazepini]
MSTALATVLGARQDDPRSVPPFQLIDEDGEPTALGVSIGIDLNLAQEMHADMVLARRLDSEALALQRQGELHLWLMSWGQEAAQVGSVRAVRDSDMIFPSYREHAVALCRRIAPADIMRQWRGVSHSGWDPAESKVHINSLVLGTQTLHATGYAAGVRMDRSDDVVLTYFGDGSASQGDVNEALNWAAAGSLPVLFFCQNNQWAISTPTHTQMRTPLHVRAAGFGVTGYHVDGNDAMAVHAVTQYAAEQVRGGAGPALIEAQTYRLAGHSSSDDPKRYRTEDDLAAWLKKDPIVRLERFLRRAGVEDAHFEDLAAREEAFAATVREQCKALRGDDLAAVFDQTYAEAHPVMDREKAEFLGRRDRTVA